MESKIISLTQFSSLAAAANGAIRELAEQTVFSGDSVAIIASSIAPADKDSYWFYVEDIEEGDD